MARSFNGTTDVINATLPWSSHTQSGTIAGWGTTTNIASASRQPLAYLGNGSSNGWGIHLVNGTSGTAIAGLVGGVAWMVGSTTVSSGAWNHLALTFNGGTFAFNLYLNGVLDAAFPQSHTPNDATGNFVVGSDGTGFLQGRAAEVASWNTILSANEILALAKGFPPYLVHGGSNFTGWLPINGLQSPEPDLSGSAHNGTLTGTSSAAGPPVAMLTPRQPQQIITGAGAATTVFRRTLSSLGTRTGSRQSLAI